MGVDWCASPGHPPDWRDPECYDHLRAADPRMFAWEWLRRCRVYRRAWLRYCEEGDAIAALAARPFGLAKLEDPAIDARFARPIWRSEHDPHVVAADAEEGQAASADLIDILPVAPIAHVAIGSEGSEHWLLSDGRWLIRLDIVGGTLLGGPALLRFRLDGLTLLPARLKTLGNLVRLLAAPASGLRVPVTRRTQRWIFELRTADALEKGASHREIAQGLFGDLAVEEWRLNSEAYRLRVQRLVRIVRFRLNSPLARDWFEE